jgi:hypothetical protein
MLLLLLIISSTLWAQELEVSTEDVQAYARIKNCIDFYSCHPYQETLEIIAGRYHWKAKFDEPLSTIQKAFEDCSIDESKAEIIAKDENGNIKKDFIIPQYPMTYLTRRHLLPMELHPDVYYGLKKKELNTDKLLNQRVLNLAMKSTAFEFEYGLGEYVLRSGPLPPNVLGQTHHLFKTITYDVEKYDGRICRFYQVMRHEIQHVRNWREKDSCSQKNNTHHFKKNNHDEISTYLNDLVFIKNYCPYEQEIYKNTQSMLLAMYQNKRIKPCSGSGSEGNGEQISSEEASGESSSLAATTKVDQKDKTNRKLPGQRTYQSDLDRKVASSSTETHYFHPISSVEKTSQLNRKSSELWGICKKLMQNLDDYDESKLYGFRKKEIPDNPNNLH